jgi:hypothetical protein
VHNGLIWRAALSPTRRERPLVHAELSAGKIPAAPHWYSDGEPEKLLTYCLHMPRPLVEQLQTAA